MNLFILGAGTAITQENRTCPSYLLSIKNKYILLDIGPTAVYRLFKINFDLLKISLILISHFHIDHILGLFHLLFVYKHPDYLERKPKVFIVASEKTIESIKKILSAFGEMLEASTYELISFPLNDKYIIEEGYEIKGYPISHHNSSLAYAFFNKKEKILVYTGDTDFNEKIIKICKGARYVLIECSFPNEIKVKGHLTPLEVAKIAKSARVKNAILTHFYPQASKEIIEKQCKSSFETNFILAEDNKLINLL